MRKTIFSLALLFIAGTLLGQRGSISGIVTELNSSGSIPYASLTLINEGEMTNNGAVSNENGEFTLLHVPYGSYDLIASFIGYKNDTVRNIVVGRDTQEVNIGTLNMSPSEIALEGVEITAKVNTVSTSIDKRSYRAADFATARGGTATDLLNKLPSVSVSPDGEVSVRGTSDFVVYLNGKPTQMEPSMLLAQISSDNIQNVEVISIPSARYDAQGKGGIININTRTRGLEGLTFTGNLLGGGAPWGHKVDVYDGYQLNDYRYSGNMGLLYNKNRLSLFGGLNYSMKNVNGRRVGDARIFDPDMSVFKHMVASGERPEWYENYAVNAGFDFDFSDKASLSGSWFYGKRTEGRSAFYIYNIFYADKDKNPQSGIPLNESWIYNPNTDNRYGSFQSANLDYSIKFAERSALDLSVLYENSGLSRALDNYNYGYDPLTDLTGDIQEHFQQADNTPLTAYRFSVNYTFTGENDRKFEAGFQPQFFNIAGDFSYDTLGVLSNMSADYISLENSIDLQRNIYAGYLNYSESWDKLSLMFGLRLEYTDQLMKIANPDYFSIFDRLPESDYEVKKLDWFPTAHATYSVGNDRFIFAASRRISRPPIKNMAPFLYRRHLEVYVVGDPSLQPEYATTAELTYDKALGDNNIALTAFYRGVDNAVFRVNTVYYDELVLIRSYTNSGNTSALGAELNSNFELGRRSKIFIGGSLYNFRVQGDVFGFKEDNSSVNWSLKGALNVNLSKVLKWTSDFDMQSATVTAQGRNEMFYFLNTALTFTPASLKNWSFNLKGLDLLASNIKGLDTRVFDQNGEQIFFQETTYFRYGPIVELSIGYSFNSNSKKHNAAASEFGSREF